eukprot:1276501-Rhodomonas_salina.1
MPAVFVRAVLAVLRATRRFCSLVSFLVWSVYRRAFGNGSGGSKAGAVLGVLRLAHPTLLHATASRSPALLSLPLPKANKKSNFCFFTQARFRVR